MLPFLWMAIVRAVFHPRRKMPELMDVLNMSVSKSTIAVTFAYCTVSAHVMLVNVNLLVDCEQSGVLEVVVIERLPLANECVSLLSVSTKK